MTHRKEKTKMGKSENWVDNPFFNKEEYENFLKNVIESAEKDDYP